MKKYMIALLSLIAFNAQAQKEINRKKNIKNNYDISINKLKFVRKLQDTVINCGGYVNSTNDKPKNGESYSDYLKRIESKKRDKIFVIPDKKRIWEYYCIN